jgi:hypothetical protein
MNGSVKVTYIVENGCGVTFQGQLTIDVNRAPLGGSVTRNLSRGSTVTLFAADLASDDPGEALTVVVLDGNPNWVSITPDRGGIVAAPPANAASAEYSFHVTVQDPGGLTGTASVILIINNLPPTALPDAYNTDKQQFTFDPTANDFDSEPGPLCIQAISVVDVPPRATIISPQTDCTTSVTVSLLHGVSTLTYDLRDSGGITSSATITINYNRPPKIAPATVSTNGQATVQVPVLVTEPDGDDVTVSCPPPAGFTTNVLDPDPDDDPIHRRYSLIVGVPDAFNQNTSNTATIACTVSDGIAPPVTATMTITVV